MLGTIAEQELAGRDQMHRRGTPAGAGRPPDNRLRNPVRETEMLVGWPTFRSIVTLCPVGRFRIRAGRAPVYGERQFGDDLHACTGRLSSHGGNLGLQPSRVFSI